MRHDRWNSSAPETVKSDSRPELIRLAWKDVGKVFAVALVLDIVYELIVYRWIYPGQALIVAVSLAVIPYRRGFDGIAERTGNPC